MAGQAGPAMLDIGQTGAAKPYRPLRRPPAAALCVLADGQVDWGEWFTLRAGETVIGRGEGEIRVPHDAGLSSRHAVIRRRRTEGGYNWFLRDLGSDNGTFLRVRRAPLGQGQEFLVGYRRYRLQLPVGLDEPADSLPKEDRTASWPIVQPEVLAGLIPQIVEVAPEDSGRRFQLVGHSEYWIGRDPDCAVPTPDDPFTDLMHAKLSVDPTDGRWLLEDNNSVNGLWWRLGPEDTQLGRDAQFQLSEQRFRFRIP